jgi:hypothetical protein
MLAESCREAALKWLEVHEGTQGLVGFLTGGAELERSAWGRG